MASQAKICDQNCPADNQNEKYATNCRRCKKVFHLPCFDIIQAPSRVFTTKNVVFLCDLCLESIDATQSPNRKRKLAPSSNNETPKNIRQPTLITDAAGILSMSANTVVDEKSRNAKISNSEVKIMFANLAKRIDDTTMKLSENTIVVSELKKSIDTMHRTVRVTSDTNTNEQQGRDGVPSKQTFAQIVAKNVRLPDQLMSTDTTTPKRPPLSSARSTIKKSARTNSSDEKIKNAMKNRQLKAGTSSNVQHALGKAVSLTDSRENKRSKIIWKSIYISRVSTDVTCENIVSYVKDNIPELSENEIKVSMLVKQGADINKFTYISFRLGCIETLFAKLSDPSFWPHHVMIGEFVERPKQRKMGDFFDFPSLKSKNSVTDNDENVNVDEITGGNPAMYQSDASTSIGTNEPLNLSIEMLVNESATTDPSKNE